MGTGFDKAESIVRRGRRDGGEAGAPVGYNGPQPFTLRGDEEAPWLKVPPFPTKLFRDYAVRDIAVADGTVAFEPIGVKWYRSLTLYLKGVAGADADTQEVVLGLEVLADTDEWFPAAVIDSTLTVVSPEASRDVYQATLVFPLGSVAGVESRVAIPYDIGFYETVRFTAAVQQAQGVAPANINLGYRLSQ